MHLEKHKIFDEYAKTQGYNDWDGLLDEYKDNLMTDDEFNYFMFEACDLVQKSQQDRIANSAYMIHHDGFHKINKQVKYFQIGADNLTVNKELIKSENNLIK